jgi:divalent metal cation (Fe/Co/Zn/Cd) transporter
MQSQNKDDDDSVVFGVRASWAANVLLLVLKLFSYYLSSSQAILAALADSVVDLVSQFVLASGDEIANTPHEKYPVGRARIESLSVMCSATIMIVASVEVVQGMFWFVLVVAILFLHSDVVVVVWAYSSCRSVQ